VTPLAVVQVDGFHGFCVYAGGMSVPAEEPLPELDAEDAVRGVISQLPINGERMPVIIPGSVIEALRALAELLALADRAGYLAEALAASMPWTAPLSAVELSEFAAELRAAASSGDHAAERLAVVMRTWHETADLLSDPGIVEELQESQAAVDRGDVIRGPEAIRALRLGP
jgi:hypothetical protein